MISVEEALRIVLNEVEPRPPVEAPLDDAIGLVLAADVASDVDSPPFDKSQMDGFAVRAADVAQLGTSLKVIEEVVAGSVPQRPVQSGEATRIMTGAPMPQGADAVVRIEQCEFAEGSGTVVIQAAVNAGDCVVRRGQSMTKGETVLRAGTPLYAPQLGLLAELGRSHALAWPRPSVGVLATGDELVPIDEIPGEGQIRNSNQTMLVSQIVQSGATPLSLGIARDNREHLRSKITVGLEADILCLSGGVSAGTRDLVPSELQAAGVCEVFHKVDLKPGKPVWFGKLDADRSEDGWPRWIFGLPGNPVSSMVCYELFVRTAVRRLMGIDPAEPQSVPAKLDVGHTTRGDRPTYLPARLTSTADGVVVRPVDWRGSFDLRATADANAMIPFPRGERTYNEGDTVNVILW